MTKQEVIVWWKFNGIDGGRIAYGAGLFEMQRLMNTIIIIIDIRIIHIEIDKIENLRIIGVYGISENVSLFLKFVYFGIGY